MNKLNMENVIEPVHDYLSMKSQARMRSVSRFFRDSVIVKKYSWYQKYKMFKDNICKESLIIIIFEMDEQFIHDDELYATYFPIENHMYGSNLKDFIKSSEWGYCVMDFAEIVAVHGKEEDFDLIEEICNHCEVYTEYRPVQSALIQLCFEEYNTN
jgi:hypothetical protein